MHRFLRRTIPAAWLAVIILLCAWAQGVWAQHQVSPEPGVYQYVNGSSCELKPLPDGSWQVLFWQGDGPLGSEKSGFSFLGRAVWDEKRNRLAVSWQSLPGSCCPGRGQGRAFTSGRQKLQVHLVFAPNLGAKRLAGRGRSQIRLGFSAGV